MLGKQSFWYAAMAGAALGWLFIVAGAFMNLQGHLHLLWWAIALLWVAGHPLELVIAMPIARKAGFSASRTYLNTLAFGLTWWIPVKLGVFGP